MAEADLYAQLAGVTALGDRVYPLKLPQNVEYPAATVQLISAPRYRTMKATAPVEIEGTFQVDIYGREGAGFAVFRALCTAVSQAIERPLGMPIFPDTERDDFEEDTELYRKSFDVRAWYRET